MWTFKHLKFSVILFSYIGFIHEPGLHRVNDMSKYAQDLKPVTHWTLNKTLFYVDQEYVILMKFQYTLENSLMAEIRPTWEQLRLGQFFGEEEINEL